MPPAPTTRGAVVPCRHAIQTADSLSCSARVCFHLSPPPRRGRHNPAPAQPQSPPQRLNGPASAPMTPAPPSPRALTCCAAPTALFAPTTTCSTTTSTSASIPTRSPSAARTPSASACCKDGTRIQLDLSETLEHRQDSVGTTRRSSTSATPARSSSISRRPCTPARSYSIDFYYSGHPPQTGRFGAFTFKKDAAGHTWINTACEGTGASIWWPNKDQWRDEVENMDISVAVPNGLIDVSNGKFVGKTDLGDGYTRWDWHVSYPINNYDVSLNIGDYVHWSRQAWRPAAGFLRAARGPGQGQDAVRAGHGHDRGLPRIISARIRSRAMATS